MSKIRGVLFLLYFAISVAFVIILMYIFQSKNRQIRRVWAKITVKLFQVKVEIEGQRDPNAKFLIMNHQSLLDIVLLESIEFDDLCWVAKKEIGKVPVYGHILKAPKMIAVDREDKRGLIKLLKEIKNRLANERTICMFPEGTRSKGDKILKFKQGSKFIAEKLNLKVQPILIVNANYALDSKAITQNATKVKIIYLDSLEASKESDWYTQTHDKMRDLLEKENSLI